MTNATLDRWLQGGKLAEAVQVPSAPPRRPTPIVLYTICDATLRTRLAKRLEASSGEVLAVQLLPRTVQFEVRKLRKAQAPRAHQRRAHPGRAAIRELQGVFHRQPERSEPDLAATPPAPATGMTAEVVAGAEPRSWPVAEAMPADLPPMPQPGDVNAPTPASATAVTAAAPDPVADALLREAAPAATASAGAASVASLFAPACAAGTPVRTSDVGIVAPVPSEPAALAATATTTAVAAAAPGVAASHPAIATLMASDAELAMLLGDHAQAPGSAAAAGETVDPARPASGAEVLRSLTEQLAGLRSEILWNDRQVATELAELRGRPPQPIPAVPLAAPRATLTSPSMVAGSIALLLLWPFVLWLRSGDLFWALAALVFANLAACTALLCAQPRD